MGVPKEVLDSLVTQKVVEGIAKRMGIDVSPEEVRQVVESHPSFQDQGKFIGVEQYKALLAANNISITEFEEEVRASQLVRKLRAAVTDSIRVSDSELRDEFARGNQQTVVDFVVLKKDDFKKNLKPIEADLKAYFDGHKNAYKIKEKRRAQYLLIPIAPFLSTVGATEQEILAEWNQRPHDEYVEAAHILFKIDDPAKEAEIKTKAESVLKQVKAGQDFAALAKKFSDDTGSASQGGILGPFKRGQMVKEFETAAFSLKAGEISGLVRSQYGFHIIKAIRHETPTLQSTRAGLIANIQLRKAKELAKQKAEQAVILAQKQKDLSQLAKELGMGAEAKEIALMKNDDNPYDFGISGELRDEVFALKQINSIGKAIEHQMGYAVPKLVEVQMPKPGELGESRAQVEKDYLDFKAKEMMKASARKLSEEASKQGSLEKAAKSMGLAVKTSQPFNVSGSPGPEIGANSSFTKAAFDLAPGAVSAPIPLLDNETVMQVKSRTPFDEAAFQKQKTELTDKLLESYQDPYFQDFVRIQLEAMEKAGKIKINQKALDAATVNY
jgi:peptidyl-prolyl cis-trans isomerase D